MIFLIGANTTEAHPVTGYRIKQAVKDGAKLIVADPRQIELVRYADIWLRHRPGSDLALLNGMAHIILKEGRWNREFVQGRTEGFEEWRESIEEYTPDRVAEITGLSVRQIQEAARLYSGAGKAAIVYAMGITQKVTGTFNVMAIANLAMLCGQVGRRGTGVYPLRGQNNVQGACDMGCLPNYFPSYQPVEDESARAKFEDAWGVELPSWEGLTLTEIFRAARRGEIKGLYIMGENPVLSDPDSTRVEEALRSLDLLVVQDIFLTETARLAHVVLPGVTFAEKEGTFTNTERRVQRVRCCIPPLPGTKTDLIIIQELASCLGASWKEMNAAEVMEEIAKLNPLYGGISHRRLDEEGGIQWPCPHSGHPGTEYLHADRFSRGKGKFHVTHYLPPAEVPDDEYPFWLITGRMLYQFHTGTMSRRTALEEIHGEELAMLHPQDARQYGINDDQIIKVISRRGQIETKVQLTYHVPRGTLFMTFHFGETPTNRLTNPATDPLCRIPELKACAIKIEPAVFS